MKHSIFRTGNAFTYSAGVESAWVPANGFIITTILGSLAQQHCIETEDGTAFLAFCAQTSRPLAVLHMIQKFCEAYK